VIVVPEMHFRVLFPDGEELLCYSPSLVVRDYLEVGGVYPVHDFVERSRAMLTIASERVKTKFGHYCSAAMDQLATIEARAAAFDPGAPVTVVAFEGPKVPDQTEHGREEHGS
jgi:uncharacterized repeat protein (TIGR04042 family)